jgi:RNA polymerase sigma factor FliA
MAVDSDNEADLWSRLRRAGDLRARDALIERYLPHARIVAARYYGRRLHDEVEFDDYLQLASMAVVESIDRYCPDQGAQFRTFASRRIHGAIVDGLERMTERQQQIAARQRLRTERLDAAQQRAAHAAERSPASERVLTYLLEVGVGLALGILLDGTGMVDAEADSRMTEPEQHYHHMELALLRRRVAELLKRLPEAQRRVMQLHYFQEQSFGDIAGVLDVTRGRVAQIHRQAIESLRHALREGGGTCDMLC